MNEIIPGAHPRARMCIYMNEDRCKKYVRDLGILIKEKALAVRAQRTQADDSYSMGAIVAYHDIVALMQSQALAFGMRFEVIGLDGINPDEDLFGLTYRARPVSFRQSASIGFGAGCRVVSLHTCPNRSRAASAASPAGSD